MVDSLKKDQKKQKRNQIKEEDKGTPKEDLFKRKNKYLKKIV